MNTVWAAASCALRASDSWKTATAKAFISAGAFWSHMQRLPCHSNVAKRIDELIQADRYLNEKKGSSAGVSAGAGKAGVGTCWKGICKIYFIYRSIGKKEINRYTAVYNFSLGDTVYLGGGVMTFFPMMIIWLSYMTMISLSSTSK